AAGKVLLPSRAWDSKEPGCGMRTKVCVADFNGDGKPDLLVGDFHSEVGKIPEPKPEEKKAIEEAEKEYKKAMDAYMAARKKAGLDKLYAKRTKLMKPADKETDKEAEARKAELKKLEKELADAQKELKPLIDKLIAAQNKVPRPKVTYHGFVWLFERQPAKTAARRGE